jgi:glycine/D-amino acid oxidase-like deaminating enzyme
MSSAVVLGSGIVGLWTAEILSSRGHQVTILTSSPPANTYSASAACVITPLFPWDPHDPIFSIAWERYQRTIAKFRAIDETRSYLDRFLESIPSYECGYEIDGNKFLEKGFDVNKFDHLPFAQVDILQIDPPIAVKNHIDDIHMCSFCARFVADFCNTEIFLAWLQDDLIKRGVTFKYKTITSIADVKSLHADVIFNCLGINSSTIFQDQSMYHIRGQSMFIDADNLIDPFFCIASGHHAIFKHRRGFYLGSYFLENEETLRSYPNKTEYDLSIYFAKNAYKQLCTRLGFEIPNIDINHIRRVNTGIRPYRPDGPRIEADGELSNCKLNPVHVVHNYGHGAHGWTIGYATAEDAVMIAEEKSWLN